MFALKVVHNVARVVGFNHYLTIFWAMVGVDSTVRRNLTIDIPEIDFGVISTMFYFTRHVSDSNCPYS